MKTFLTRKEYWMYTLWFSSSIKSCNSFMIFIEKLLGFMKRESSTRSRYNLILSDMYLEYLAVLTIMLDCVEEFK
jgi:hypothetical protein